jgi:tetratricopeptide (TPR) repeat protein
VLEVISVLRLHIDDDTYRFPPAQDFAGKNVYRASVSRLESLEQIYGEKFKSGYLVDVIWFAKGRGLERIGEFELAAMHYRRVTDLDSPLREEAGRSARICEQLAEAAGVGPDPSASPDEAIATFEERRRMIEELLLGVEGTHYVYVVREQQERADLEAAEYFRARRRLEPGLDAIAVQQYQRLVQSHRESRNRDRNILSLGDLYAELARDYVRVTPPVSLHFDPATFDEYAFAATRLYESVSQRDGAIEKIEAARKLEAFLAFTLAVHDEKLPR